MAAISLEKMRRGDKKVGATKKKQLEKHVGTNQVHLQQVNNMIGYKKEHLREGESLKSEDGQMFSSLQKTSTNSRAIL